jgi:hypothetical protein
MDREAQTGPESRAAGPVSLALTRDGCHTTIGRVSTPRFWLWAGWHGATLGFILLTTALADAYIVPVTVGYCAAAGFITALWTRRPGIAGIVGATTALSALCVLLLAMGITHWGPANRPPLMVVVGLVLAIPTFAVLGLVSGVIGGAIASPRPVGAAVWGAVTEGPAWRAAQLLRRASLRRH